VSGLTFQPKSIEKPGLLLCFSHLRWNFVYQRPQHLISRASKKYDVIYIEEPLFEGMEAPYYRIEKANNGVEVRTPILPENLTETEIIAAQKTLVDLLIDNLNQDLEVCWYYTPMALEFSHHLRPALCVYDCMDELSAFRGASIRLIDNEKKLFAKADLVFTGGMSLFEAKRHAHPSVHAFPSSVDQPHFRTARDGCLEEPELQKNIAHPRVGFFGVIDERMDLDLVEQTALLRPDLQFVMLGPVVKIDPATLPRQPNIHWLGAQDYQALPNFLSGWDVGFMPFALNESTKFISPTKTPEFLAAGLPVVSTPITDVVRPYGKAALVEIVNGPAEMAAAIDRNLKLDRGLWLRRVDLHLSGMSWDATWDKMWALMFAARAKKSFAVELAQPITPLAARRANV
jgi:glycosyltransferase involved in cell wall biosynthesis